MSFNNLKNIDLEGKRVLMRVDFNVPLDKKTGKVADNTRIRAVLPTLQFLLSKNVLQIILMSHIGRPKGQVVEGLRTKVVGDELSNLLNVEVDSVNTCLDVDISLYSKIVMLENVRFYPEEKKGDRIFAEKLANYADIFVNDAFAVSHRAHASITTVAEIMKEQGKLVAPGLLVKRECEVLSDILEAPASPFLMIVSGAKIDTKIGLIQNFLDKVDTFILGGGIANTFLAAQGLDVAGSLYEEGQLELAKELLLKCEQNSIKVINLEDAIVASELSADAVASCVDVNLVSGDMKILDIGEKTINTCKEEISKAKMIVWNGPVGVYEIPQFSKGTHEIANAVAANKDAIRIIGGGDTVDAINRFGIDFAEFTHVSTGGGAMVEFLEGKSLPGINVLEN